MVQGTKESNYIQMYAPAVFWIMCEREYGNLPKSQVWKVSANSTVAASLANVSKTPTPMILWFLLTPRVSVWFPHEHPARCQRAVLAYGGVNPRRQVARPLPSGSHPRQHLRPDGDEARQTVRSSSFCCWGGG